MREQNPSLIFTIEKEDWEMGDIYDREEFLEAGVDEVSSDYVYPDAYKVKPIKDQVETLRRFFPALEGATYNETIAAQLVPPGAEGWFAIPRWRLIGSTYGSAVDSVIAAIDSTRRFRDDCEGMTDSFSLREHKDAADAFRKIGDDQKDHQILVIPCQFGLRHRGRSVRFVREMVSGTVSTTEFCLGSFAVGCMILTHPERETQDVQLHVECGGDEMSPEADNVFSCVPSFRFVDERVAIRDRGIVRFGYGSFNRAYGHFGSASAFLM